MGRRTPARILKVGTLGNHLVAERQRSATSRWSQRLESLHALRALSLQETFAREATAKRSRSQRFFAENAPKTSTSDARKKLQKEVDTALTKNIKDKMVLRYLGARFSLTSGDAPHAMKF